MMAKCYIPARDFDIFIESQGKPSLSTFAYILGKSPTV